MTPRAGWVQALTAECEAEAASLQPPEGDAALRRAIVERLEAHAQTVAPGSRLRVFGSSSCGLNAAGADPDMESRLISAHLGSSRLIWADLGSSGLISAHLG